MCKCTPCTENSLLIVTIIHVQIKSYKNMIYRIKIWKDQK